MIPDSTFSIYWNPKEQRYECLIEMTRIKGVPLSMTQEIPASTAEQLTQFLEGSLKMLEASKRKAGKLGKYYIPDLLGNTHKPADRFLNFVIEHETNNLFYTDFYPLAEFHNYDYFKKGNYKHKLVKAAIAVGHPAVIEATRDLTKTL